MAGYVIFVLLLVGAAVLARSALYRPKPKPQEPMLSHNAYFTVQKLPAEKKAERVAALVHACKEHLSGHPGTVWFMAGTRAGELQTGISDVEFDVALHLVFKSKVAFEAYKTSERRQKFIQEHQVLWEAVRAFTFHVGAMSRDEVPIENKTKG